MKLSGYEFGHTTGALTLCTKAGNGHAGTKNGPERIALCLDYIIIERSDETIRHLLS